MILFEAKRVEEGGYSHYQSMMVWANTEDEAILLATKYARSARYCWEATPVKQPEAAGVVFVSTVKLN